MTPAKLSRTGAFKGSDPADRFSPLSSSLDLRTGQIGLVPVHSDGYFDIVTKAHPFDPFAPPIAQGMLNRESGCVYRANDRVGLPIEPAVGGQVLSFRVAIWDSCQNKYVAHSNPVDLKYFGAVPNFATTNIADAAFSTPVLSSTVLTEVSDAITVGPGVEGPPHGQRGR